MALKRLIRLSCCKQRLTVSYCNKDILQLGVVTAAYFSWTTDLLVHKYHYSHSGGSRHFEVVAGVSVPLMWVILSVGDDFGCLI